MFRFGKKFAFVIPTLFFVGMCIHSAEAKERLEVEFEKDFIGLNTDGFLEWVGTGVVDGVDVEVGLLWSPDGIRVTGNPSKSEVTHVALFTFFIYEPLTFSLMSWFGDSSKSWYLRSTLSCARQLQRTTSSEQCAAVSRLGI